MRRFVWLVLILNAPAIICLLIFVQSRMRSGHVNPFLFWFIAIMTPYFFLPAMISAIVRIDGAFSSFGWAILPFETGFALTFAFYTVVAFLLSRITSARSSAEGDLTSTILDPSVRNWWALAGRGVLAALLGLTLVITPGAIGYIAPYMLADGILCIVMGAWGGLWQKWLVALALKGIVSILVGTYLRLASWIVEYGYMEKVLLALGFWGILGGSLEAFAGLQLMRRHREWLLLLNGAVTVLVIPVLVGSLVLGYTDTWITIWLPVLGRLFGGLGLVSGVILLAQAVRLRSLASHG
jgi:hypothetical protein